MTIVFVTLLIFFVLASGFFSLAQIALFSLSSFEIKYYEQDSDPRRILIARLLKRPKELLVTLMICDILANILAQNTAANLFGDYSSWFLTVGVPLVLTLFIGEIFPKTLALPNKSQIAYNVAPSIFFIQRLLGPIRTFTTHVTNVLSKLLFFFLKKEEEISAEELHHVLRTSEMHGILTSDEAELIDGYLSLQEYTVKNLARPREEILYYDLDEPLSKLIHLFVDQECSRLPICSGDLQNTLGIFSAKTFFLQKEKIEKPDDIKNYLEKPLYIPETISAKTLLKKFKQSSATMAIVIDEYGSISGLITEEDLIEIVIGDISDRRDLKHSYTVASNNDIIASGKMEIYEFEELFNISLPSENHMVTLGGWLIEKLGDIPKSGTKYVWNDFIFHVLAADPNRVRRVYIRKLTHQERLSK